MAKGKNNTKITQLAICANTTHTFMCYINTYNHSHFWYLYLAHYIVLYNYSVLTVSLPRVVTEATHLSLFKQLYDALIMQCYCIFV